MGLNDNPSILHDWDYPNARQRLCSFAAEPGRPVLLNLDSLRHTVPKSNSINHTPGGGHYCIIEAIDIHFRGHSSVLTAGVVHYQDAGLRWLLGFEGNQVYLPNGRIAALPLQINRARLKA
jgi:hypothetical protein